MNDMKFPRILKAQFTLSLLDTVILQSMLPILNSTLFSNMENIMLHPHNLILLALPFSVIVLLMTLILCLFCKCWLQNEDFINDLEPEHSSYEGKGPAAYIDKYTFCFSKGRDSGHNALWI